MTPPLARSSSSGRYYVRPSTGEKAPSVTTVLSFAYPKPGLMPWAVRKTAEYAVTNRKAVDGVLSSVRLHRDDPQSDRVLIVTDPLAVESAVALVAGAPWRERDRAGSVGTAIHRYLERETLGEPGEQVDDALWPFVQEWLLWKAEFLVEFEMSEATVWYEGIEGADLPYAGTADAIVNIGGKRLLVDYKTGENVYPDAAIQLWAYAHAQFVLLRDGREEPMPKVDGVAILHLRPEGYTFLPVVGDELEWYLRHAWQAARFLYEFAHEQESGLIGAPLRGVDGVRWTWPEVEHAEALA